MKKKIKKSILKRKDDCLNLCKNATLLSLTFLIMSGATLFGGAIPFDVKATNSRDYYKNTEEFESYKKDLLDQAYEDYANGIISSETFEASLVTYESDYFATKTLEELKPEPTYTNYKKSSNATVGFLIGTAIGLGLSGTSALVAEKANEKKQKLDKEIMKS